MVSLNTNPGLYSAQSNGHTEHRPRVSLNTPLVYVSHPGICWISSNPGFMVSVTLSLCPPTLGLYLAKQMDPHLTDSLQTVHQ